MKRLFRILMDDAEPQGGGGTPPAEPEVETPPEPTDEQRELAALKEENAKLKEQQAKPAPAAPVQQQPVTSATLETYNDEQWAAIEAKTGKDKNTIINEFKQWEITNRQNTIDAKNNTNEILQDALETNPKLLKLRSSIKEYMEEVPVADKLDPAKLKRALDKAILYAKGKHADMTPNTQPNPKPRTNDTPNPKGGDETPDGEELMDGEVKDGEYEGPHNLKIKTGKIDKKLWKNIQHKNRDPNGVCIPHDFDKPPVFK